MCKKQIKKLRETDDMSFGVQMKQDSEKGYFHQMQRDKKQTLTITQRSPRTGHGCTSTSCCGPETVNRLQKKIQKIKLSLVFLKFLQFKKTNEFTANLHNAIQRYLMEIFPFLVLIFIPFNILIVETCGLLCGKLTHNDEIQIVKISISLNFFLKNFN